MRPPDSLDGEWRCDRCGPGPPLHLPAEINTAILRAVVATLASDQEPLPLWCPWPLPEGWTLTGVGWVGDDHSGARATVLASSGPAPLTGGPADLLLIAEAPGTGLANRYAGLGARDPGPLLTEAMAGQPAHAKPRVDRHPTPLWSVPSAPECSTYIGEARGLWMVAVTWPANAGYLLAEDLTLQDLVDWSPGELVFGAPTTRLRGGAGLPPG